MARFFAFEQDFIDSLRCIPMIVRYKLDTCGVKLKLNHWHSFSQAQKDNLVNAPCHSAIEVEEYKQNLQALIHNQTGEYAKELDIDPQPEWLNHEAIPVTVQEKAQEFNLQLSLSDWQKLDPVQRFALIKLSRPSHENRNFLPALQEFNLI